MTIYSMTMTRKVNIHVKTQCITKAFALESIAFVPKFNLTLTSDIRLPAKYNSCKHLKK